MTYAYDNNGNLSQRTDSSGQTPDWAHTWDYKDRLLSSENSQQSTAVSYAYDEAGARVTKTNQTSGKVTTYVSDLYDIEDNQEKLFFFANGLKLATLEGIPQTPASDCQIPEIGDWTATANCTISTFKTAPQNVTVNANTTLTIAATGVLEIDLHNKHLLVKDTGGLFIKSGGSLAQTGRLTPPQGGGGIGEPTLIFHHSDHLSGAAVDTDIDGNILQLTDYYPFGDSRIEETTETYHNDYTYTGKERDEDTELLYYEARYYDSTIGRFISLDPWGGDTADPQSFNKYAYVRNNPLKYVDPDGEKVWLYARRLNSFGGSAGVHTFLLIEPDHPEHFGVENHFSFVVGGFQNGGGLVGEIENPTDKNWPSDEFKSGSPIEIHSSKTDTEFINSILEVYSRANDGETYDALSREGKGYNCNNFATSLVIAAGGELPEELDYWGWNPGLGETIPGMMDSGNSNQKNGQQEFQSKVIKPAQERDQRLREFRKQFKEKIKRAYEIWKKRQNKNSNSSNNKKDA